MWWRLHEYRKVAYVVLPGFSQATFPCANQRRLFVGGWRRYALLYGIGLLVSDVDYKGHVHLNM